MTLDIDVRRFTRAFYIKTVYAPWLNQYLDRLSYWYHSFCNILMQIYVYKIILQLCLSITKKINKIEEGSPSFFGI